MTPKRGASGYYRLPEASASHFHPLDLPDQSRRTEAESHSTEGDEPPGSSNLSTNQTNQAISQQIKQIRQSLNKSNNPPRNEKLNKNETPQKNQAHAAA